MSLPESSPTNSDKPAGKSWVRDVVIFFLGFGTGSACTVAAGVASGKVDPDELRLSSNANARQAEA
jgi:hypothetical protein